MGDMFSCCDGDDDDDDYTKDGTMQEPLLGVVASEEESSAAERTPAGEIDDELAPYMPYIEALTRYYAEVSAPFYSLRSLR